MIALVTLTIVITFWKIRVIQTTLQFHVVVYIIDLLN